MTADRTLLYVRTPQGRALAFTPEAKLSPALKAMLKAVDGKISVAELVVQFADADASDLLGQLDYAGLIKLREVRTADFQNAQATPSAAQLSPPVADFADTHPAPLALLAAQTAQPGTAMAGSRSAASPEPAALGISLTGLALIVDVMSTFVLTHLPQQAFTVLGKLEGFKTLDELQAELPDYSMLAKASGPAGVVHLAELTERVREAAAA